MSMSLWLTLFRISIKTVKQEAQELEGHYNVLWIQITSEGSFIR